MEKGGGSVHHETPYRMTLALGSSIEKTSRVDALEEASSDT